MYDGKKKKTKLQQQQQQQQKNTRKDNLSVILSSLPLSHRFVLSLSQVIHNFYFMMPRSQRL